MKTVLSLIFVWFLVIQSFGVKGRAIAAIPMQSESICNQAISAIQTKSAFVEVKYNCIDAGNVSI